MQRPKYGDLSASLKKPYREGNDTKSKPKTQPAKDRAKGGIGRRLTWDG
jgi:hypothetical protein